MNHGIRPAWSWTAFLMIFAALPFLIVQIPSASDYPNHLARHHVFAAIGSPLDNYFEIHWRWVGNLGVDLPVLALSPLLGAELATRLVSAMIAPLTVLGIVLLSRSVHGRVAASAMVALPFVIAQPLLFGFLNYSLSVALALLAAAAWNRTRTPDLKRALLFAPVALVVWTAHIMGWAVMLILIGSAEVMAGRDLQDFFRRSLQASPLLAPLIPLIVWRAGNAGALYWYDPAFISTKVMNFVTALRGLSMPLDLGMMLLIGLCAVHALLKAGGRRVDPGLGLAGGLLTLATLLLPTTVLGSWGADLRLAPVAIMVAILAIGPARNPRFERLLFLAGVGLFLLRASYTCVQWWRADHVLQARLTLLDHVPRGSRLGFLSIEARCKNWALTPDRKLGAYAVVRRDAFTNTLFQIPGADIMTMRKPSDRRRWYDGSQDIALRCPKGTPDVGALKERMMAMRDDGFVYIWIAGLPQGQIPRLPGLDIAHAQGNDSLVAAKLDTARRDERIVR